jgi:N,N-dimethylformamidase
MAEIKLFGYTNKLSVKPGENIDFHVSADGTQFSRCSASKNYSW